MTRWLPRVALAGLALGAGLAIIGEAQALDVRCARGPLVRAIEVRFARDADGLPCAVIWQTMAGAERRELVWRSDSQLDFCTDKARELVLRLVDGGWTCESAMAAEVGRPALTARLEPAAPEADAALWLETEPRPENQLAPSTRRAPEDWPRPERAVLQAALARDLARLDQLSQSPPGSFRAQTARLGDLDGDRTEEAVALVTHRPGGAPPSLHLLAYRFDGETFRPVARIALSDASNAQIHDIIDGVIEVIVHAPQPGDLACCPSGRGRASFVLRDDSLVRLPEDQSWDPGRRVPAGRFAAAPRGRARKSGRDGHLERARGDGVG